MITKGTSTLSNEELIAIIIGKGNQRFNGVKLGTKILDSVGNSKNLLDLNYHELVQMRSISTDKACSLIASFELAKRVISSKHENKQFISADSIYEYLHPLLSGKKVEHFYALYLDVKSHLIESKYLTIGTQNGFLLDIKEVIKHGIRNSCYAIVLVHNHPSGDPTPSREDIELTKKFQLACQLLNIQLLDHVVIGDNEYTPLASEYRSIFELNN